MSLADWAANRWIIAHAASPEEIENLFAVVDRSLKDASIPALSADGRLTFAYNAGLQLATIALAAEGYRPGRERSHERAINSLQFSAGVATKTVNLLDLTRRKRNTANYEQIDMATDTEVEELLKAVKALRSEIARWLKQQHPALYPRALKA